MTRTLVVIASVLIALIGTFFVGADYGRSKAEIKSAQAQSAVENAWRGALVAEVYKRHTDLLTAERKAREASAEYEKALKVQDRTHAAGVADIRHAGGLRIPAAACPARPAAAGSEAAGTGRPDEGAAASVELPERTQERLFALTLRAGQLTEQLIALQGWVRSNGFYGTSDENSGNP